MISEYLKLGWFLIPVFYKTKTPVNDGWNNINKTKINKLTLAEYMGSNIGLLLGEIIDVEADNKDKDDLLNKLLKDYHHPIFKSSNYNHHLFINPYKGLTRFVKDGIEFRAYNHYSLLPPSIHPNGLEYIWLSDFKHIPPLPIPLRKLFSQLGGDHVLSVKNKNAKKDVYGFLKCSKCDREISYLEDKAELEKMAFALKYKQWECPKCRDRQMFEFIRQFKLKFEKKELREPVLDESKRIYDSKRTKIVERRNFFKDNKKIYKCPKNQKVESQRETLLVNLKSGETDFRKILDYLYYDFDKGFNYRQKKTFFSNEIPNEYFFIDFCLEYLRICVYIDDGNVFVKNLWDKYYKPLLEKYKYKVIIYSSNDVINKPNETIVNIIKFAIETENNTGVRLKNFFKRKPLKVIAENYTKIHSDVDIPAIWIP